MISTPPSFGCSNAKERVPYTLVCDYHRDCVDNSDEDFCRFPTCDAIQQFQCESKQCTSIDTLCDGFVDCLDETDEWRCDTRYYVSKTRNIPAIVTLDGRGMFTYNRLFNGTTSCPDTHFKCLSIELCMPVYVRCNSVYDCPEKEDEKGCDTFKSCPGFYRCRGLLNTFLHPNHLCDGWSQCPQHDDERFCNLTCPEQCSCLGHSWFCRQIFEASAYLLIRYINVDYSGMKLSDLSKNTFLIYVSLYKCGLTDFKSSALLNLHSLYLGGNRIQIIAETDLTGLPNLNTLVLTGNPLTSVLSPRNKPTTSFPKLTWLDLSDVKIKSFNSSLLVTFPNLQVLNLSGCGLEQIQTAAFQVVPKLQVLDISRCPLRFFPTGMLKPLTRLRAITADNFKVCCPVNIPNSYQSNQCDSTEDKIASCNDLFKSNLYRISWNVATCTALVCNMAILFKRLNGRPGRYSSMRSQETSAVDAFVKSLFANGCIHVVYMMIIGIMDASFRGSYMLHDTAWKQGHLCAFASFLWLFSTETSLFLVSLITLERVLGSWCPRVPLHFSKKSAVAVSYIIVSLTAVVALLPWLSGRKLFQQTALCSPLLLSTETSDQIGIVFLFNVTVSWFVGLGQVSVYVYLHRKKLTFVHSPNQTRQLGKSRQMMAVVLCDVVYWIAIGLCRHLIASGIMVSSDGVVVAQVSALPFIWTLKPVLHVVAVLLEHRRRDREERILKMLMVKLHV